jgi:hypothetical protein
MTEQNTENIEMAETVKLTEEEKIERKRAYQREYRLKNLDKVKDLNTKWRAKNIDKIKDERKNNKAKYAEIQKNYDHKMANDPNYLEKLYARQKRYRDNKKANPHLYKQPVKKETEAKEPKKRGRKPTRGIVKVDEPAADE